MRSIWNGHIRLGLVTVPVGLAVARQRARVSFRTLHRPCGTPVTHRKACERCGVDVDPPDTIGGFEFSKGLFAIVEPAERETLDTRRIEVARLVPAGQIPTIMVDQPYWLVPAADPVGRRPYRLLHDTLAAEQLEALASAHLFGADHVCRIRAADGALLLEQLYAANELRAPAEIVARLSDAELTTHEVGLARRLARHMAKGRFRLDQIDGARDRGLERLIEAKMAGRAIVAPEPAAAAPVQLADALRASLDEARARNRAPARA